MTEDYFDVANELEDTLEKRSKSHSSSKRVRPRSPASWRPLASGMRVREIVGNEPGRRPKRDAVRYFVKRS